MTTTTRGPGGRTTRPRSATRTQTTTKTKRGAQSRTTTSRPAAKRVTTRRPPAKRATTRSATTRRPAAKRATTRSSTTRKPAAKRATTRSSTTRRPAAKPSLLRSATGRTASPRTRRHAHTVGGDRLSAWIMLVTIGLTLFGLVMVLSASSVSSLYQLEQSPLYQFKNQAIFAVVGAIGFFVARSIDYRLLARYSTGLVGISIVTLIAVLIPGIGQEVNGSRRWLNIGIGQFQPSEFAKLAMVVFVADLLSRRSNRMDRPDLTVRPVMVLLGVFSALLLLQPKLGTPVLLAAVAMTVLFVAGAKTTSLAAWSSVGLVGAAFFSMSSGYRRDRIFAFLDPWEHPATIGLQTIQSQVGIASGGFLGVGLGASRAKWGFLPEAQSDFIFAIVAEEVGLLGAGALIGAFLMLGILGTRVAMHAPDRFGTLLAAGITTWLLLQAFLNIGMTLGKLPITGEPLPFVSAGGSSLIMSLVAAGLLANIARRAQI